MNKTNGVIIGILARTVFLVFVSILVAFSGSAWARDHLQPIREYLDQGNPQSAIIELKNILQANPDEVEARLLLGKALLEVGDNVGAESQLKKAKDLGLESDELELMLAYARLRQGRLDEVVSNVPAEISPQSELQRDLFVAWAEALLGLGKIDEAANVLERVLAQGAHARALGVKARIAALVGEADAARDYLDRALGLAPNEVSLVMLDARWLSRQGQHEAALERYSDAIDLDPQLVDAYFEKTQVHLTLRQLDEAGAIIETLKANQPDNPLVVLLSGLHQYLSGDFGRAKISADRVLASAANNPQSLFISGASAFRLQQYEQARSKLSAYLTQRPQDATARALLGAAMLKTGSPVDAYGLVRDVEQIPDDNPGYLSVLSAAALQAGDAAAGLKYVEQLAALAPDNAEVQERLGGALIASGDLPGGIAALHQAVTIEPTRLSAQTQLFAAHLQAENIPEALAVAEAVERNFPNKAVGPNLLAFAALRTGDRGAAKAASERALKREPGDMEAGSNLANILWLDGDVDHAREVLEGLLATNPNDLRTLVRYAALEERSDNLEKAETLLRRAVEEYPDAFEPSVLLAQQFLRSDLAAKALEISQPLLAKHGDNLALLEVIGMARHRTGDRAGALEAFSKLVELTPGGAQSHAYLMEAQERTGDIQAALASADRALALEPSLQSARFGRVRYLAQQGRLDEAKTELAALKAEIPNEAGIYIVEGRIALVERRPDDALESMKRAHALRADSTSLLEVVRVNLTLGRQEQALSTIATWLAEHPDDVLVRNNLAEFLIAKRQMADAKRHYEILLEKAPNSARLLNNLAWVQTELGAIEEAIVLARKANDLEPENAEIADTLAKALLKADKAGDQEEALKLLANAVRGSPNKPTIRFHFAQALSDTGDRDAAIRELQGLLESVGRFPERVEAEALLNNLTL